MNLKPVKTLGIDITQDTISFAYVSGEKGKFTLIKSGTAKMPDGAMCDGNIVDHALIAKTIKKLISSRMIRMTKATVSLPARSSLVQLIDLPEKMPENVRQYVSSEIKHSAMLSGKDVDFDYIGLKRPGKSAVSRVFVSAADREKVASLIKALNSAGISPNTIEPTITGWMRSIYEKKIKNKFKSNVLLLFVCDGILNLVVFKAGVIDFIRSIDISQDLSDMQVCIQRCKSEIASVVQYYDIEIGSSDDSIWEVIADLPFEDSKYIEDTLKKILSMNISVCSGSTLTEHTPLEIKSDAKDVSLTAVGLALNHQKISSPNLKTDLIPQQVKDIQAAKKESLTYAACAAAVLMLIFVASYFIGIKASNAQQMVDSGKNTTAIEQMKKINLEHKLVQQQVETLKHKQKLYEKLKADRFTVNWPAVLAGISHAAPDSLYLTKIENVSADQIEIKGNAFNAGSVHRFARNLPDIAALKSANIRGIKKGRDSKTLEFSITCMLSAKEGGQADAD